MSPLDELIVEANRQLRICNACRYCEGYCAVYPALESRDLLTTGDMAHLANLCHDCRACYYACMYAPPHEFAINPPEILSKVRIQSYELYFGPVASFIRKHLRGKAALLLMTVISVIGVLLAVSASHGLGGLWHTHKSGSPYTVINYESLISLMIASFAISVVTMALSARRYWIATHGKVSDIFNLKAWGDATDAAAKLRYMAGGGGDCYYPQDKPSLGRKHMHSAVMYGFTLCVVATIAAGVMQDIAKIDPPYGIISLPVLTGLIGGILLLLGSTGLIAMKAKSNKDLADAHETAANYGFLIGLDFLAITGILTLLVRHDAAFGPIFGIHLAAIVLCFLVAPYTKFVHFIYRYLALVKDAIENQAH